MGWRRAAPGLLAVVLSLGVTLPARADSYTDAQNKAAQAQKTANYWGTVKAQALNREAQLQAQIAQLGALIAADDATIQAMNARIADLDGQLADTQFTLDAKENQLAAQRKVLEGRTRLLYKEQGAVSFIDALMSSDSFATALDRYLLMRDITQQDGKLVDQVKREKAEIEALKASQVKDRADQQAARDTMAQRANAENQEKAALRAAQLEAGVQANTAANAQAAALATVAQAKSEMAAIAEARKHAHSSGVFAWPGVQGPITQPFGCVDYSAEPPPPPPYSCPPSRPYFHYGIDIGGPYGAQITATDGGIAYTYVSSYGYGLHVIIAHANGYTSLYGHMSGFAITSGQNVAKGQLIGYEGSTGNSSGAHLHFEIDLNNTPVNPCNYVGC